MKIDGRQIAATLFTSFQKDVDRLYKKGITPHLAVILVGNDPASESYVRQKKLKGEGIGMKVTVFNLPERTTEQKLLTTIKRLNNDNNVHGIIIQQPLPKHINPHVLTEATDPEKDVDGFHTNSMFTPPIAEAAIKILESTYSSSLVKEMDKKDFQKWLVSKNIVIIGKGKTGGRPIRNKLEKLGASVTVIDSKTKNQDDLTKKADVIVSCVGKPNILTGKNIKNGVILLSVGMFRGKDGKLHGDYEEEDIKDIADAFSPVPGGIGPVNVAMLLSNVLVAAKNS